MNTIATEESDGEWRHQACDAMQRPEEGIQSNWLNHRPEHFPEDLRRERWLRLCERPFTIFSSDAGEEAERS
jgi:hypothetical protein